MHTDIAHSLKHTIFIPLHVLYGHSPRMTVCKQASYNLLSTLRKRHFVTNKDRSSLNFAQPILILTATLSEHLLALLTWSPR
uniref:Uncharacterized protein n=1 Tax=Octopus bimaculoides TaxID=37653 RepID=A0A0L8H647_OCTBM